MRAAITVALALPAALAVAVAAPARASGATPVIQWFVKGQDAAPWNNNGVQSVGLAVQAAKDEITLPAFTWTGCGVYNGESYSGSDYTNCAQWGSSAVLITENYYQLRAALNAGWRGIAMYDLESWPYTPAYQWQSAPTWLTRAAQLVRSYGAYLIESAGGKANTLTNAEAAVTAGANAYMIAIQSQGWGWNGRYWAMPIFDSKIASWLKVIRAKRAAAHTATAIMAGLGTNTPLVHPLNNLRAEYTELIKLGIRNIWLNANNWGTQNRCTPVQGGPGCPEIGVQFLAAP